ncbi:hypothetical protein TNCV_4434251 [Trichonephila clavipes]|nr:hypothetical protein TNCV_4434251 [Trichonephila clavipes]
MFMTNNEQVGHLCSLMPFVRERRKQFERLVIILVENHSTTMMRSKMELKCGSDNRRQPSITVGYKSLCSDLKKCLDNGGDHVEK